MVTSSATIVAAPVITNWNHNVHKNRRECIHLIRRMQHSHPNAAASAASISFTAACVVISQFQSFQWITLGMSGGVEARMDRMTPSAVADVVDATLAHSI